MKQADHPVLCRRPPRLRYVRRGAKITLVCPSSSHLPFTGAGANDNSSAHLEAVRLASLGGKLLPLATRQAWSGRHGCVTSGVVAALFAGAMVLFYVALVERLHLMSNAIVILVGKG